MKISFATCYMKPNNTLNIFLMLNFTILRSIHSSFFILKSACELQKINGIRLIKQKCQDIISGVFFLCLIFRCN